MNPNRNLIEYAEDLYNIILNEKCFTKNWNLGIHSDMPAITK